MRPRIALLAAALATALATMTAVVAAATPASAATLTQVTNFGTNPTNLQMHLYVPDRVAARPALLLALHYCSGSGPAVHSTFGLSTLADRYGYIVIYPSVTRSSKCWDVSSPQALRRGGGSDPVGLKSMIDYVRNRYPVDANRIGVAGFSSGAMMTNVMAGVYPDVFHAGVSSSGVPFGCFATTNGSEWNSECSGGRIVRTPQQWGDLVRNAYPGYTGKRPRMQIWHGTTDTTLSYVNFGEQVKQWTNVLGVSQTPSSTDYPQTSATRTRYGGTGARRRWRRSASRATATPSRSTPRRPSASSASTPRAPPRRRRTRRPPRRTRRPPAEPDDDARRTRPRRRRRTPPAPGGCSASVSLNSWTGGFVATVKVTAGSSGTRGWTVSMTLPGGTSVTGTWSASASGSSGTVRFTNVDYNGQLGAGQVTEFGFQGNGSGAGMTPTCTAS